MLSDIPITFHFLSLAFSGIDIGTHKVRMTGEIKITTANGQKTPTVDGCEARLCAIYLKDVASLLLHRDVSSLRQVSHHSLHSIRRPPRRHYEGLLILF